MMRFGAAVAAAVGVLGVVSVAKPANATVYNIYAFQAPTSSAFSSTGGVFPAVNESQYVLQGTNQWSEASFGYVGPLNFATTGQSDTFGDLFGSAADRFTSYGYAKGSGLASTSFDTLSGFLATQASDAAFTFGTLIELYAMPNTGETYGGEVLTITHDAGASITVTDASGNRLYVLNGTTTLPSGVTTESVALPAGIAGYEIVYAVEGGAPSVLQVAVPEPVSMVLLATGLAGLGATRLRRRKMA